jgi:hypothetical protein
METAALAEDGGENSAVGRGSRLVAGAATFLLIAGLLYFAWVDLRCAGSLLAYPFGDYGEGIVWQQALLIPGPRMYGPIDHLPFIVFHYPPVYHLMSRAVMSFGIDPLAAGRIVSLAANAVIAIGIAWLVAAELAGRIGRSAVLVGAVTGRRICPQTRAPNVPCCAIALDEIRSLQRRRSKGNAAVRHALHGCFLLESRPP